MKLKSFEGVDTKDTLFQLTLYKNEKLLFSGKLLDKDNVMMFYGDADIKSIEACMFTCETPYFDIVGIIIE